MNAKDIKAEIGSYVLIGNRLIGETLKAGTQFADAGFRGCQFYLPTQNGGPIRQVAVDIRVTGRTLQRRPYQADSLFVKVQIVFVGDCEPDTYADGWLHVRNPY
jgi:hypothetical protein